MRRHLNRINPVYEYVVICANPVIIPLFPSVMQLLPIELLLFHTQLSGLRSTVRRHLNRIGTHTCVQIIVIILKFGKYFTVSLTVV